MLNEEIVEIGQGWKWKVISDIYTFNDGEFNITRDIVQKRMDNWGRKIEKVHLIAVLNKCYREFFGLN